MCRANSSSYGHDETHHTTSQHAAQERLQHEQIPGVYSYMLDKGSYFGIGLVNRCAAQKAGQCNYSTVLCLSDGTTSVSL